MAPLGLSTRRHWVSQAREKRSYSAKEENLSQASSTPATTVLLGRKSWRSSCRLYGGSAKTRSTLSGASRASSSRQSPTSRRSMGAAAGRRLGQEMGSRLSQRDPAVARRHAK